MKRLLIIGCIFNFFFISFSQSESDTLFLFSNSSHSKCVFSLKYNNNQNYQLLLTELNKNEEGEYIDNIHYLLQDTFIALKKTPRFDLNSTWIPLYVSDGNYYLSDSKNKSFQGFILTDSTLITKMKEGISVDLLLNSDKNESYYSFTVFSSGNKQKIISIYWLDIENQIAIWKVSIGNDEVYFLCVSEEKYKNFPIAYYKNCETNEFNFDNIDLKKVIEYNR